MPKALIIGMGVSGRSAARFLLRKGYELVGVDRNPNRSGDLDSHMLLLSEDQMPNPGEFDLVILSPGIPPNHPAYQKTVASGVAYMGEAELALRYARQPVLGITGTNGKTTVAMLTAHVLNQSGIRAKAMGNIGKPLTEEIEEEAVIVAELSSYQLETMESPVLDAAVILNISSDHLDRYASLAEYAAAKLRIRSCLKPGAPFFVEKKAYQTYGGNSALTYGAKGECDFSLRSDGLYGKENIEYFYPVEYRGKIDHDRENEAAAYLLCRELGVTGEQFQKALRSFVKPPHRIEFVTMHRGVAYYNDSKGTNVDAVMRAVDSMEGPVCLIAGGQPKGEAFTPWVEAFREKVKEVILIGSASEQIEKALLPHYPTRKCGTLEEAVSLASTLAKEGGNVLLSPGCASFDMFRDYAHRGEEFKRIVKDMTGRDT